MVIIDKCLANKSKKLQLRKNRFIFIDERCKFPLGSNSKLEMYAYNTLFDTIRFIYKKQEMIKEIAFHLQLRVYHVHSKITTCLISIKTIPNLLATHNIAIIKR